MSLSLSVTLRPPSPPRVFRQSKSPGIIHECPCRPAHPRVLRDAFWEAYRESVVCVPSLELCV
eukprot:5430210-Pyramimonas_sp.AAC.1